MPLSHEISWSFAASNAASHDACALAEAWARSAGLPEVLVLRLVLVIEELFTNTIKHGYCGESNHPVHISLGCLDGMALLDYRDQAPLFDPIHTRPSLPMDTPPDHVGGMGLQLIQTLGCNASFVHEGGWNITRLGINATRAPARTEALIARKKRQ
jgi:serine/threonine-protein kinase RsbW